VMKVENTTFAV